MVVEIDFHPLLCHVVSAVCPFACPVAHMLRTFAVFILLFPSPQPYSNVRIHCAEFEHVLCAEAYRNKRKQMRVEKEARKQKEIESKASAKGGPSGSGTQVAPPSPARAVTGSATAASPAAASTAAASKPKGETIKLGSEKKGDPRKKKQDEGGCCS